MTNPGTLVLIRHGESTWNASNRFTGLLDVPLSDHGCEQVDQARELLGGLLLDSPRLWTSPLQRARHSAEILAAGSGITPELDWRLCERDYGCLTNMSRLVARARFGESLFARWRRTLDGCPPAAHPAVVASWPKELTAAAATTPLAIGCGESLADVVDRLRPVWWDLLLPGLLDGRDQVVIAHGNSLRALCYLIDELGQDEVLHLNVPSAEPLLYRFGPDMDPVNTKPLVRGGEYLEPDRALEASEELKRLGGT